MADFEYSGQLTIKQILDALNQIDKSNEKVWKKAEKDANRAIKGIIADHNRLLSTTAKLERSLAAEAKQYEKLAKEAEKAAKAGERAGKGISDGAKLSGTQLGVVSGIVQSLTTSFINLGQRAVESLIAAGKESVNLASDLETTQAVFEGIFQGNEDAAIATLARVRKESRDLGVDLQETSRAFLPFVENLKQLSQVGQISAALAISQPEQGALGARVALQEFLSGSALSLVRRFEIPKNLGKELEEALATGGVEAGLNKLDEVLKLMGRDIENLGDTFQLSLGKAQISFQQLQTAAGQPILDVLKEQFDTLNQTVTENFDDFEAIADAFGRVLALITEIVASNLNDFLANLDTEQVIEIAETFFDLVEDAKTFIQVLNQAGAPIDLIDGIQAIATGLDEALQTAIKLTAIIQAEQARSTAVRQTLATSDEGKSALGAARGRTDVALGLVDEEQQLEATTAGQEAFNKSIEDSLKLIDESTKRKEENRKATDDFREAQDKSTQAGEGAANAFLQEQQRLRELADAQDAATEAQQKINEATEKAELDLSRKLEDIDIETARKRLDILQDFADKRVDAARENAEKIADIERKNQQAIDDARLDKSRDDRDAEIKLARAKLDQAKDEAQKQIDIEEDFQQKLADIRKQFDADAEEAERNRDAVSFLRAMRARDQEIQQAQDDRQQATEDARKEGEERRAELQQQFQFELIDNTIAHNRKLEDLQTALDRELETQRIAFAREQEEININEARKLEELQLSRERDIEDAQRSYDRKLADLQTSLAAEFEAIKAFNELSEAEAERHLSRMEEIAAAVQEAIARQSRIAPEHLTSGRGQAQGDHPGAIPGFAEGGNVSAGQPAIVGERGPELFVPSISGVIIPNSRVFVSPQPVAGNASVTNFVNEFQNQFPLSTQDTISPVQRAIIEQMIVNAWSKLRS